MTAIDLALGLFAFMAAIALVLLVAMALGSQWRLWL
jgi:hypothetical protein